MSHTAAVVAVAVVVAVVVVENSYLVFSFHQMVVLEPHDVPVARRWFAMREMIAVVAVQLSFAAPSLQQCAVEVAAPN